jgi:hypothetical protein
MLVMGVIARKEILSPMSGGSRASRASLLFILLAALGLMVGIYARGEAFSRIGRILAVAAVAPLAISLGKNYFGQLGT